VSPQPWREIDAHGGDCFVDVLERSKLLLYVYCKVNCGDSNSELQLLCLAVRAMMRVGCLFAAGPYVAAGPAGPAAARPICCGA